MPLPNSDIVSAFFESYITIRKGIWNLDVNDNDSIKIPDSAIPVHKITICNEMLLKFKNALTFDDWLAIVDDLYEKERAEDETQQNRFLLTRLVTRSPLILDVLRAARTYIISEIKTEDKFKDLKKKLTDEKVRLVKEILYQTNHGSPKKDIDDNQKLLDLVTNQLNGRDESIDYYISFFNDTVTQQDPEAKKLDEKSFNDFKKNVLNNSRTLTLCKLMLESSEKKANSKHNKIDPTTIPHRAAKEVTPSVNTDKPAPSAPVPTPSVAPATSAASTPPESIPAQQKPERKPEKIREQSREQSRDQSREPSVSKPGKEESSSSALAANSTFANRRPATYGAVVKNLAEKETENERYEKSRHRSRRAGDL